MNARGRASTSDSVESLRASLNSQYCDLCVLLEADQLRNDIIPREDLYTAHDGANVKGFPVTGGNAIKLISKLRSGRRII